MAGGAPAGRGRAPSDRLREIRTALSGSPWPRRLSRLLALAAGVLLVAGALQPWAYVPFGGLRLPLYGLFGPGSLALVTGLWLLSHPRPGPALMLAIAAGASYLARVAPQEMLATAHAITGIIESWLAPLNQLLARFHIDEIHLTDWALPAARAVGPGVPITLWGAALAAAAALSAALALPPPTPRLPRRCPACTARLSRYRELRFCPACGGGLTRTPICRHCRATSEPGDQFCAQCGERLL